MTSDDKSYVRRVLDGLIDLLPTGGIGDEHPAPDVDGRRDTDSEYRQMVLRMKSQLTNSGQGTTSFERVDRNRIKND